MKLKTSFFNITVLKKDFTRFAPIWGLYTVFQLLFVLLQWDGEEAAAHFLNSAPDILQMMGMVNFVYAGLCAVMLFGDLFNPRMCNALHAMPLRREGWFATHLISGLLFCIGPNAIGTLVATLMLQQYSYGAFIWFAVMLLQFLFFFSVGVFCVMCAGNRLGAIAMYLLANLLAVLVAWLIITFYQPVLYGIILDADRLAALSPVVSFTDSCYFETEYGKPNGTVFKGFIPEDWWYLFAAAAAGIVLLALALLIYRKRKLESAGDFISAKPAEPVFLVLYTLCAGAVMYVISEVFSGGAQYLFMVIGFAIGFFTGRMLLERKVNVFRKKSLLPFCVLVFAFFGSIALTWLDPIGVTRYVPKTENVAQVQINPYESAYYRMQERSVTLTQEQDIKLISQIHQELVEDRTEKTGLSVPLYLRYKLKDGRTVERQYYLPEDSTYTEQLRPYYSSPEFVLGTTSTGEFLKNLCVLEVYPNLAECPMVSIGISENWIDPEANMKYYSSEFETVTYTLDGRSFAADPLVMGLFEAIEKDCREGNMVQLWEYHRDSANFGNISLTYQVGNRYTDSLGITVYDDCTHTVKYLKSLQAE